MADAGAGAAEQAGQAGARLHARGDPAALRHLQPHRQRVLLRPPPALLQLHPQLLPHGHSARH